MQIVKIISAEFDKLHRRVVKFLRFGLSDVQTALEAMPYGIDGNPIQNMVAVYSTTSEKGKTVIVGYLNVNQLAEPGELRTFSTDSTGEVKFYTWLKKDGTFEIGGNADNAVRYAALNSALQSYLTTLNTAIGEGVVSAGGAYTAPPTLNISSAKINEIKTL